MLGAGTSVSLTTWAVCTPTKEPGDGSAESEHRSCPTRRATTGRPLLATEAPLSRGFFATRPLTEKRVPPMRREGAAVEASAASGAAASVALAEA
jgi:hypothetical protein